MTKSWMGHNPEWHILECKIIMVGHLLFGFLSESLVFFVEQKSKIRDILLEKSESLSLHFCKEWQEWITLNFPSTIKAMLNKNNLNVNVGKFRRKNWGGGVGIGVHDFKILSSLLSAFVPWKQHGRAIFVFSYCFCLLIFSSGGVFLLIKRCWKSRDTVSLSI